MHLLQDLDTWVLDLIGNKLGITKYISYLYKRKNKTMKKYKVILLSGGFDPVHKGHIECINKAKELADEVWIGLQNGDLHKGEMAFGNGGDRTETTTPENDVCDSYGIESVWGLGEKIQSSSWLLEKYLNIAE